MSPHNKMINDPYLENPSGIYIRPSLWPRLTIEEEPKQPVNRDFLQEAIDSGTYFREGILKQVTDNDQS